MKQFGLALKLMLIKQGAVALFAIGSMASVHACLAPHSGFDVDLDDLIAKANTIVVVRLQSSKARRLGTEYTLKPIEVIKGTAKPSYVFLSRGSKASDNDFIGHTRKDFWTPSEQKTNGRSPWPCCVCGPDHGFREGRDYLYFPDKLGAVKSAEVIRVPKDRWLEYVRDRVAAASKAPQATGESTRASGPTR
jgi:hypothetical protein